MKETLTAVAVMINRSFKMMQKKCWTEIMKLKLFCNIAEQSEERKATIAPGNSRTENEASY